MQRGEARSPVLAWVLTWSTCLTWGLFHLYQVLGEVNRGLGRREFDPVVEVVFCVLTVGLWSVYLQWRLAGALVELQRAWGVRPRWSQRTLRAGILVGLSAYLFQASLNHAWEEGTPGGSGYGGPGDY